MALTPWIGTIAPYNIIFLAIVVTPLILGTGPALLTVILGDLAVEVFVLGSLPMLFTGDTLERLGVAIVINLVMVLAMHAARVAVLKAQDNATRLLDEIEERKQAEGALQASEARYRTLFDTMTEGFALHEIVCDDAGRPIDYRLPGDQPGI